MVRENDLGRRGAKGERGRQLLAVGYCRFPCELGQNSEQFALLLLIEVTVDKHFLDPAIELPHDRVVAVGQVGGNP